MPKMNTPAAPGRLGSVDKWRVSVCLKSGGDLDLGTWGSFPEAVQAAEDFQAEREDVVWTRKSSRSAGEGARSYVLAIGRDGVTDPSIVVTRVEARTR